MNILRGHAADLIENEREPFDLIATDPPYAFGGAGLEHALSASVAIVLRECGRRLASGGWMIVFCAASWRSTAYTLESLRGVLEPVRIGFWGKPKARTKAKTAGWAWQTVPVIAFRRGSSTLAPTDIPDFIVAEPAMNGRRACLPPAVCEWAVRPWAIPGGRMLDPFAGSGALCAAAEALGMHATGYEIQES